MIDRRRFLATSLAAAAASVPGGFRLAGAAAPGEPAAAAAGAKLATHERHRGMSFGYACKPGFYSSPVNPSRIRSP
ncbi:MAG: hypothetical protein ACKODK_02715 [Opitutaceae bacterium]